MRCASKKIAQPEPSRRSALLRRPAVATSSAGVAESRSGPRMAAVRWKEPSLSSTTPGATSAAQGRKSASVAPRARYSRRNIMVASRAQQGGVAQVTPPDFEELGIPARRPDSGGMAGGPDEESDQPQPQAEPDRTGQ